MGNVKTLIDQWSVRDLEDNSSLTVVVQGCTELGNQSVPGIQIYTMGSILNYEPGIVEQWVYKATKANETEYLLENNSWMVHEDQYIKHYLLVGSPLKARVIVKTRSSKPVSKDYELPFDL
ncbi:hypothetical protein [Spirosoma koreense]